MKSALTYIALITLSAVSLNYQNSASASDDDQKAVQTATKQFYTALNELFTGEVEPMKKVWSHQDDITFMGPDGSFLRGWKPIAAEWEKTGAMKLGGKVEASELHITVGQELAIVNNYEIGHNVGPDGKVEKVKIRATSLFRKEEGKWKMIGHHTDLLPFLSKSTTD